MNEKIKIAAKIGGKTFLKWIFILILGCIITSIFALIALYKNIDLAGGGHGNAYVFLITLPFADFCGFLLLVGSPAFIALYFIIANKIAIQNTLYLVWKNKAGDFVTSKIGSIINKLTEKKEWANTISNEAMLRAKILQANKDDHSSSKLQRKVINYGFKKIKLDDIDFQNEDLKLSDVLINKFNNFISEVSKPSLKLFWLLILLQIILLICSLYT